MNKKAIELSINFIVIIIISVVIFSGGIILSNKMFKGAQDVLEELDSQSAARIEALLDDGARVAMPFKSKDVARGESAVFGVGILNVLATTDFKMTVSFNEAYDESDNRICSYSTDPGCPDYPGEEWLIYDDQPFPVEDNQKAFKRIMIKPKKNSKKGIYIFDVQVQENSGGSYQDYDPKRKLLVNVE